jgi:hypothetical protein
LFIATFGGLAIFSVWALSSELVKVPPPSVEFVDVGRGKGRVGRSWLVGEIGEMGGKSGDSKGIDGALL